MWSILHGIECEWSIGHRSEGSSCWKSLRLTIQASITYNQIQIPPIFINPINPMILRSDLTSSYSICHLSIHLIKILNCTHLHHPPWPEKLSLHHLYEFLQYFSILSISYRYLVNVQRNFPCITIVYRLWPSHPWTHRLSRLHPPSLRPYHSPMISRPKNSSHLSIHTSFRSFCAIAHCNPPTLSKVPCFEVTSDELWKSLGGWPKNLSKPYSSRWHVTELSIQCSTMTLWTTRWNVHNRLPPVLVVEYYFMEYVRHTKDFHRDFDAWCSPSKSKHPIYD